MADHRLDLPGDAWADIRDPRAITRGARKPVRAAMLRLNTYGTALTEWATALAEQQAAEANPGIIGAIPLPEPEPDPDAPEAVAPSYLPTEAEAEMLDAMQEALTVALVADWSYDGGVSVEALNAIPADAADVLVAHCAGFIDQIFVNVEPPKPDATVGEDSPT